MKSLIKNNNNQEKDPKISWWFGFLWLAIFIIAIACLATNFDFFRLAMPFIFLLVFLFVPEEYGLYSLALFLPVINWNFYYHNLELPLIDLLGLAVFLAFIAKKVYTRIFDRKNFSFRLPFFIIILSFLISAFVSSFFANNIVDSLWYFCRWILFIYFIYLVFPVNAAKKESILKNSIICFVFGGIITAVGGFLTIFSQDWRYEFVRVMPFDFFNIYPLGSNHNLIAETLIVSIALTQSLKYWIKSLRVRRLLNILTVFQIVMAIGTFSRAAWISLGVMVIICLVVYRHRLSHLAWTGLLLVFIILSPFFVYMYRLQSDYTIGGTSTENRLIMAEIAWDKFLEKPLFGQGNGTFIYFIGENIRFTAKYGDPLDSHGFWQKILLENGLFGVFTFGLVIGGMFIIFARAWKKYGNVYIWFPPLVLGSVGIVIMEFFNTSYYKGKMWLPIAFCFIGINIIRAKEREKKYEKK